MKSVQMRGESSSQVQTQEERLSRSRPYRMVIGEAGESCAFYIADRLGMPNEMLRSSIRAAYGEEAVGAYHFQKEDTVIGKKAGSRTLSGGL